MIHIHMFVHHWSEVHLGRRWKGYQNLLRSEASDHAEAWALVLGQQIEYLRRLILPKSFH